MDILFGGFTRDAMSYRRWN